MTALNDAKWMRRAIRMAGEYQGKTHPNPTVGCVIVRDDLIVAEGCHRGPGTPHAEVDAIRRCDPEQLRGATCYVTLEPCNHHGRTPPCTDTLLESGIRRVVFALPDVNPNVCGGGAERLRNMGLEVESHVLADAALPTLETWMKWIVHRQPFVILKLAASLDGRVATCAGESRWISGEKSRKIVHQLRKLHPGIMAGAGTILADDPLLTAREGNHTIAAPVRIIVDHDAGLPERMNVFNPDMPGRTLWVIPESRCEFAVKRQSNNLRIIACPEIEPGKFDLEFLMDCLGREEDLESILLEGGPTLAFSMIQWNMVDKLMLFLSPMLIGGRSAPSAIEGEGFARLESAPRLRSMRIRKIAEDVLIEGYLRKGPCSPG